MKMMEIENVERFKQYLRLREGNHLRIYDLWLILLLFGSMGAITWAIRGTAGWGGVDGTVVPGMMWAVLWYYLCYRIGIDARSIVFWLGFGIALGGELGYGQYTSWILGKFYVGEKIIPIEPWVGYLWFMICGIGWAAPGGILLGWALGRKMSGGQWILRILLMLVLLIFFFAWPVVDWLASQVVDSWPGLIFPHADMGIYAGDLGHHLQRTIYTNTQNFAVLLWWAAALLLAVFQKDKTTLVVGLLLGVGFGIGFMQSAAWCLGYGFAPDYIDWWKLWELNAGFNLGLLYALTLFWAIRQVDKAYVIESDAVESKLGNLRPTISAEKSETVFLAIAGSILIYFMGFEYFFWSGLGLSILFLITMIISLVPFAKRLDSQIIEERRLNILLTYTVFLLVFLMLHGGSERAGFILGLYPIEAVDQYAWPVERIILFAPFAFVLLGILLYRIWKIISPGKKNVGLAKNDQRLANRMVDLMTGMGFIGALSIWPAKIGVCYAFFLMLALFALNRINDKYNFETQRTSH